VRRVLIGFVLLLAAGCSEPPQKEIDQAQSAIDTARAAGAQTYAAEEYAGATETLQKARASVDQRDYRQALSYAIDARQRAIEAARTVADARTRQIDAEGALRSDTEREEQLETALRDAEAAHASAQQMRAAREAVDAAKASLQEARRLLDAGNFAEATTVLVGVRKKIDLATQAVDAIPQHGKPVKRRH
jgi:predicted S18 family serine protease